MCLGVPGRIVEINGLIAVVDFWGMRREVRLEIVDEPVAVGDYILNHVGYAIRRIPENDIQGTLDLYEQLLREAGADDLMTADVRGELAATSAGASADETEAAPVAGTAPALREAASDRSGGPSRSPSSVESSHGH